MMGASQAHPAMTTICLQSAVNSHGPDPLQAAPGARRSRRRVQAVAGGGDDEVIAAAAVPTGVGTGQPNAPCNTWIVASAGTVVIVEAGARGQSNQGLSQRVLVPAVHGVRAAATVGVVRGCQMLSAERGR